MILNTDIDRHAIVGPPTLAINCLAVMVDMFRGAVGETTFHVCFLMGTPNHMFIAKRMLKWYPLLLNDIYLSEVGAGEDNDDDF